MAKLEEARLSVQYQLRHTICNQNTLQSCHRQC